jgi:mannose-1-phosphate guanylyltransferase/mannose-1-phosphate guanylyltransferase/phosphomannomutase
MVLAAGLGTRLRPLTYEITKPMVPVLDRPVMEHIVELLERHGITEVIANLHYFPDSIREHFGDRLQYHFEAELLGTAGGVRACASFFGDEPFLVISGDALTDIDLGALIARHRDAGGIATLAVKRVPDTREFGVVLHDRDGRVSGFQEKPDPAQALSDLGNCGIYVFDPRIFEYFPEQPAVDWATDVFPALLENDVPFHIHELHEYWNDIGSLSELRHGTFDALRGELRLHVEGTGRGRGQLAAARGHRDRRTRVDRPRRALRRGGAPDGPGGARRRRGDRRRRAAAFEHRLPRHRGSGRLDPDRGDQRAQRHPAQPAQAASDEAVAFAALLLAL